MGETSRTDKLRILHKSVLKSNHGVAVTATGWVIQADGSWLLDQNLSAKQMIIPISGLVAGDVITGFRIIGSIGAKAGGTTTLDADLRRNLKGAGSITDASVGAITQITAVADAALDTEKEISNHEVADDYFYYVSITGTTLNNAENDIFVTGIEVDIKRKLGAKGL